MNSFFIYLLHDHSFGIKLKLYITILDFWHHKILHLILRYSQEKILLELLVKPASVQMYLFHNFL